MTKDEFKGFVTSLQHASKIEARLRGNVISNDELIKGLNEHDKGLASAVNDWLDAALKIKEHIAAKLESK